MTILDFKGGVNLNNTINLEVTKTIYGKFVMWFIPLLIGAGLININQGVKLTNKFILNDKIMKMRLNKRKWQPIDLSDNKMELYSYE